MVRRAADRLAVQFDRRFKAAFTVLWFLSGTQGAAAGHVVCASFGRHAYGGPS